MSNVKIVTGKCGSGKTNRAIEEFVSRAKSITGAFADEKFFLIVPDQFAVEIERKVFENYEIKGTLNGEIMSINRYIHRLLGEFNMDGGGILSTAGKSMLLIQTIHELSRRNNLTYFKSFEERPQSVSMLLDTLNECKKYNISKRDLEDIIPEGDERAKNKLSELGLILETYQKKLQDSGYTDKDILMNDLIGKIEKEDSSVKQSYFIFDSFSGFTANDVLLIGTLAKYSKGLTITLAYDKNNKFLYKCPNETFNTIAAEFERNNIGYQIEEINAGSERFKDNQEIKYIAEQFPKLNPAQIEGDGNGKILLYSAPSSYYEINCAADKIYEFVSSGNCNFSDIALILPDIDELSYIVEAVFKDRNIPYFIDSKRMISAHPAIRYIICLLKIISSDMQTQNLIELLKTGLYKSYLYDKESVDEFEKLTIIHKVRNKNGLLRMIGKLKNNKDNNGVKLAEDVYNYFYGSGRFVERFKNETDFTVNSCLTLISKLAEDAMLWYGMEDQANSESDYTRIWKVFHDLCEECSRIIGNVKITGYQKLAAFVADVLMSAVENFALGFIPTTINTVQIGDVARSRFIDKKIVMILGANDGKFPSDAKDKGILGDAERMRLQTEKNKNLGYDSLQRAYLSRYNAYNMLVMPTDVLYLSFSLSDTDGSQIKPSESVERIKKMFKNININHYSKEPTVKNVISTENISVDKDLIREMLHITNTISLSASSIETYADCPHRYFADYILNLKNFEDYGIHSNNAGSYYHILLEKATKKAVDEGNFGNLNKKQWKDLINEINDEIRNKPDSEIDVNYIKEVSECDSMLLDRILDFSINEIDRIEAISNESNYKPVAEELTFGKSNSALTNAMRVDCGNGITAEFSGKIDRLDSRGNGDLMIVDYKSGKKTIPSENYIENAVENGELLQLLVYYSTLKENFGNLANIAGTANIIGNLGYYLLGKDSLKTDKTDNDEKHRYVYMYNENSDPVQIDKGGTKVNIDDLADISKEAIRENVNNLINGTFTKSNNDNCKYCKLYNTCSLRKESKE